MIDQALASVVLVEQSDSKAVLGIRGTNYQMHLHVAQALSADSGDRVQGVIRGDVWKVDFVSAGGAYIEPVFGRPRRVQGRVVATDPAAHCVVLDVCGCPFVGMLAEGSDVSEIPVGTRVGLDIRDGATFDPA